MKDDEIQLILITFHVTTIKRDSWFKGLRTRRSFNENKFGQTSEQRGLIPEKMAQGTRQATPSIKAEDRTRDRIM